MDDLAAQRRRDCHVQDEHHLASPQFAAPGHPGLGPLINQIYPAQCSSGQDKLACNGRRTIATGEGPRQARGNRKMDKKKIETVNIRPHMHGLYRYTRQVIIDQVPADNGREFLL